MDEWRIPRTRPSHRPPKNGVELQRKMSSQTIDTDFKTSLGSPKERLSPRPRQLGYEPSGYRSHKPNEQRTFKREMRKQQQYLSQRSENPTATYWKKMSAWYMKQCTMLLFLHEFWPITWSAEQNHHSSIGSAHDAVLSGRAYSIIHIHILQVSQCAWVRYSSIDDWRYISFVKSFSLVYQCGLCRDIVANVQEDHDIPYHSYKGIPLDIALRRTCKVSQGKMIWYRLRTLHWSDLGSWNKPRVLCSGPFDCPCRQLVYA